MNLFFNLDNNCYIKSYRIKEYDAIVQRATRLRNYAAIILQKIDI